MRTLFDAEVHVHYGQVYVWSNQAYPLLDEAFAGQANGLCGAASPGALFMITGVHTGHVRFTIELHDEPAPMGEEWEDIVEVSFTPMSSRIELAQWAGEACWPLDLPDVDFRVRYCACGMDDGRSADTILEGEPGRDRYLLQFWPGAWSPDRVVKLTSDVADYWHRHARTLPPPPTPEDKAAAEHRATLARRQRAQELWDRRLWGDRPPTPRLRTVGGNVLGLAALDRDLVDALAEVDAEKQRAIAAWAARMACERAGLADLDWVAPALDALDHGESLPAPFDDSAQAFRRLSGDERPLRVVITHPGGAPGPISQKHAALPAVTGAADTDPLRAAIDALYAAVVTFGDDFRIVLAEVRGSFLVGGPTAEI